MEQAGHRPHYVILPAEPRHLPHLPGIEDAAGELFSLDDLPEPARSTGLSHEDFEAAFAAGLLWLVVETGTDLPVAFLMGRMLDGGLHIVEFDVHPQHARRGIGSRLLEHVLAVAARRAFRCATLTTFEHVPWNAPYYSRHGFEVVGADRIGPGLARVLEKEHALGLRRRVAMRKDLEPGDPLEIAHTIGFTA